MRWSKYAALGDSFTEGLDDPYPDRHSFRGWADLVAESLGAEYANLAVRGRLFDTVANEQVAPALAMKPDLISFAAGGNCTAPTSSTCGPTTSSSTPPCGASIGCTCRRPVTAARPRMC